MGLAPHWLQKYNKILNDTTFHDFFDRNFKRYWEFQVRLC